MCHIKNCDDMDEFLAHPRLHMEKNHSDYQCSLCDRKFFLEGALEQHMAMSSHEKKRKRSRGRKKSATCSAKPIPHEFSADLRLSNKKKKLASAVVNHIKNTIEHNSGLNIANVYRSGSTAKGTALEKGADIDVILYANTDQNTSEFTQTTKQDYLNKLHDLIDKGVFNWGSNVKIKKQTAFHIGLSMTLRGIPFDVDVVVSRNTSSKLTAAELQAKYHEMARETPQMLQHHSSELVRLQTDKIKQLPPQAKDVILQVKFWKQKYSVPIKSYFVELVVLHKYEEMGESVNRNELLEGVVDALAHADTMKVTSWPGTSTGQSYVQHSSGPVMVDPVNPFNNVAPSLQDSRIVVRAARQT